MEWKKINLEIIERNIEGENIYGKYSKPISQLLQKKQYKKMKLKIFPKYMNQEIGILLKKWKKNNNKIYQDFLNKYSAGPFMEFKILNHLNEKGIYKFVVKNKIVYIGRCLDNFKKRFNFGYGKINPKNCYKDGQSTNCRINNYCNKEKFEIFVYCLIENSEIKKIEKQLIKKIKPCWNINR